MIIVLVIGFELLFLCLFLLYYVYKCNRFFNLVCSMKEEFNKVNSKYDKLIKEFNILEDEIHYMYVDIKKIKTIIENVKK